MRVDLPGGGAIQAHGLSDVVPKTDHGRPDWALYLDRGWRIRTIPWPYRYVEWPDGDLPDSEDDAFYAFVEAWRRTRRGELVEVACYGGTGRTGTALACIAHLDGIPHGDAVAWVRSHCHEWAVERIEEVALIARFAEWAERNRVQEKMSLVRVATWNCQTRLEDNWDAVEHLNVDVLTVQECEPGSREFVESHPGWTCRYREGLYGKGLSVMAHEPYRILEQEDSERFVLSTVISGPEGFRFRFVGFWAMTPKAVGYSYTRQASLLIEQLPEDGLPTMVAGDFNASKSEAHLRNVEKLKALGLVSAYHKFNRVPHQRKEVDHTSYFLWNPSRPYHMDLVFVPERWPIRSVKVGSFADYPERGRSDHVPVVVTVAHQLSDPHPRIEGGRAQNGQLPGGRTG